MGLANFKAKIWAFFSTDQSIRTSFYFFLDRNYSIKHSVSKKLPSIHVGKYCRDENFPFSVKLLITMTCRNSLIDAVTNNFYSGFLIRRTNETDHESLIVQLLGDIGVKNNNTALPRH